MSTRRILHQLDTELPAEDLSTAERVLQALSATAAPHVPLEEAPLDDEPDNDDFDGGLAEARADAEAGRVVPHEEVKREELLAGVRPSNLHGETDWGRLSVRRSGNCSASVIVEPGSR